MARRQRGEMLRVADELEHRKLVGPLSTRDHCLCQLGSQVGFAANEQKRGAQESACRSLQRGKVYVVFSHTDHRGHHLGDLLQVAPRGVIRNFRTQRLH